MLHPNLINILMTDAATLKKMGFLSDGIDEKLVPNAIRFVQDDSIESCLGSTFYNLILQQINDNAVEDRFKILLDNYILNAIGYLVNGEMQVPLSNKLRNAGNIQTNDQNIINNKYQDVKLIAQWYTDKGEFYLDYMLRYIRQNIAEYPEFFNNDSNDKQSSNNAFRCSIFTGSTKIPIFRYPENKSK